MAVSKDYNNIRPHISLLSAENKAEIHSFSISILENTGIRVESDEARDIFKKSNSLRIEGDVVFIQKELIDHSIKSAPASIDVYSKTGDLSFQLGKGQENETHFGIGVTNTHFQEIESGQVIPFTRQHMQEATMLGELLDNYEMISTLGVPVDADPAKLDLFSSLDMYSNTSKPLVLLISESKNINALFDLLEHLHGDISSKPFCIPYFNPITPLVLNKSTTDKMIASINRGLPIMYSNYSMYGGTSPITEGGSLALLNAELLAGLVFSQLIREGSQVVLGSLPAAFNMSSMGSYYTPTTYLLNLACAEMMEYYEIPHCGTSGSSNGWGPDLRASGDLWQNHLTSCLGKVGCVPFVGGNFDSIAFSPENVVLSNYIIGEARKMAAGFTLSDRDVNLPEIKRVGHGGNYFTSDQTLESLGSMNNTHDFWPSLSFEAWQLSGNPTAEATLKEHTLELYQEAQQASKENLEMVQKGEEYIAKTK